MTILLVLLSLVICLNIVKDRTKAKEIKNRNREILAKANRLAEESAQSRVISHQVIRLSDKQITEYNKNASFRASLAEDDVGYTKDLVNILTGRGVERWQTL